MLILNAQEKNYIWEQRLKKKKFSTKKIPVLHSCLKNNFVLLNLLYTQSYLLTLVTNEYLNTL